MRAIAALSALVLGACAAAPLPEGDLVPQRLERTVRHTLDYYLYLPEGYEDRDDWPLVVFLHGGGEAGDDLSLVAKHGPPAMVAAGRAFPFVLLAPQSPHRSRMWDDEAVLSLIDETLETRRVDPNKVVVTGLSRGGMATWRLGMQHPERFAGLVPIAGGGLPVYAFRLKDVPVWAFYGAKDEAVALDDARRVADRLAAEGGDVEITIYPEADHVGTWEAAYADPRLWAWIAERERKGTK